MKEFVAETGGRYTYSDDILNLQDLAISISSIFQGCGNFVINGCKVSGTTVSDGYIFLNGKIRKFAGASGIVKPCYIVEKNSIEKVAYFEAADKIGRKVYGCALSNHKPTENDPVTKSPIQYLEINSEGKIRSMEEAFFGKYTLTLHTSHDEAVQNPVTFQDIVTVRSLIAQKQLVINGVDSRNLLVRCNEAGDVLIESLNPSSSTVCKLVLKSDGAYQFYTGPNLVCEVLSSGIVSKTSITTPLLYATDMAGHLNGPLKVNMLKGSSFLDFIVGDGKGTAVLSVHGAKRELQVDGQLVVSNSNGQMLTLRHKNLSKTDNSMINSIQWMDKDNVKIAQMGYTTSGTYDFYVQNLIGDVRIQAANTRVIGKMYVNDIDFDDKVGSQQFKTAIKKTDSIQVFVDQAGGGEVGQKKICEIIGAASFKDTGAALAEVLRKFTDIGLDTGWQTFKGLGVEGKARQIGHTVYVYGYAPGPGDEEGNCLFDLPENITYPLSIIKQTCGTHGEYLEIGTHRGQSRTSMTYASATTNFSVTYLV